MPWLSWGRLRYDHTQGILFGWLGNAFLAFLYHAVPVLTGRPVTSVRAWSMVVRIVEFRGRDPRMGCWFWRDSASRWNGRSFRW